MKEELSQGDFGPIHSDLHRKNIVHQNDSISFIDFDDSVVSHYLLDIAIMLTEFEDYTNKFEQLSMQLFLGYGLTIDPKTREILNNLQKIGDLIYADWIFGERMDKLDISERKIKYGIEAIRSILNIKL